MAESLRDRQKAQVRAEIQRAALPLFAERGFDAVTTEEIAAAAGVGHSTYFRYVPTKEDLLLGAFRGTGAAVVEDLEHRPADESAENALWQAFLERSQAFVADEESVRQWRIAVRSTPIRLRDVAKPSRWADVWSSYSLFDSAYANSKSFGSWIDSCNGYLTLIPSILFIYGLTFDIMPARALGIMGLIIFSIMCYGTVAYYAAYIFNKEFRGHTRKNLALFIRALNSLWIVGPIWGMVACITLIDSNSFGFVR